MPGGPPTSKQEEQIEQRKDIARREVANILVDKLEEILGKSTPDQQQKIVMAVNYILSGYVYGYHPAEERVKKLLQQYSPNYSIIAAEVQTIIDNNMLKAFRRD